MPNDQRAKDSIRLQQCVQHVRMIIGYFGEPMVLDALAVVVETPDGKALLSSAAEFSRAIEAKAMRQAQPSGPGLPPDREAPTVPGKTE